MNPRREPLVLSGVAAVLTLLVLAPLAAPGYVLSYDLVFVPHQLLTWDLLAPAASLPRAVPQDVVVSLLNLALPGWLLERLFLAAIIFGSAYGAGRLVPAKRLGTRVVAAVAYAWTPLLAERLLLGQWGLLLAYAALPWLVGAARSVYHARPYGWVRLVLAAAVCAITPTGGLIAFAVVVGLLAGRARQVWWPIVAVGLLNAPWLVASLVSGAGGRSDPAGVAAFAARAENWAGAVTAVLGTGGVWNAATTPASRGSAVAPVATAVLLLVAGLGLGGLRRRWPDGFATRALVVAGLGLVVALAGALPGLDAVVAFAVGHVPGAGLLRDGTKFVLPYALVLSLAVAMGVEAVVGWLSGPRGRLVVGAAVLLPLAILPDLAWGGAGALRPVSYPPDWDSVAGLVADGSGEVLALPMSEYRAYSWNHGRTVIDPAPRYLPAPVLADDVLVVGPIVVAGESPRAAAVRARLAADAPVAGTGVRWVLVEHDHGPVDWPGHALDGLVRIYQGEYLDLYVNPSGPPPPSVPGPRRAAVVAGYLTAVAVLLAAVWYLRRSPTTW